MNTGLYLNLKVNLLVYRLFFLLALLIPFTRAKAIYNGTPLSHEHPLAGHTVLLLMPSENGYSFDVCGGLILAKDTILTAAHCVDEDYPIEQIIFDTRFSESTSPRNEGLRVKRQQILVHPGYSSQLESDSTWLSVPDLALINFNLERDRLHPQYEISEVYQPVTFSEVSEIKEGTTAAIAGYGSQDEKVTSLHQLRKTKLKTMPFTSDTTFALEHNTSGNSWGDSGSGAFIWNSESQKYELLGVQYFVDGPPDNCHYCELINSSYFIKVISYKSWIEEAMKELRARNPVDKNSSLQLSPVCSTLVPRR